MRIFVASWFFPPQTSSEGIVTYKLLRNSQNTFDVVCADSSLWGYEERISLDEKNIHTIQINTDDLDTWKNETLRIFRENNKTAPYDAVMTRCMPNESLEIGLEIKREFANIKWICSLADPVANNPYWLHAMEEMGGVPRDTIQQAIHDLALPREQWSRDWTADINATFREQFTLKDLQDRSLRTADMIITPSKEQQDYMAPEQYWRKFLIIPHSYDEALIPSSETIPWDEKKKHFLFTGYADALRSLRPFVDAVKWIKDRYPALLEKFVFHFYGNYSSELIDRAYAYEVDKAFDFGGSISYSTTLNLMKQADWLLHVDAYFPTLGKTGGSIFFAGKLADYMGARKPILALTGTNSPAHTIVEQYGGISCDPWEIAQIAKAIMRIVSGGLEMKINEDFRSQFDAVQTSARFDEAVASLVACQIPPNEVHIVKDQLMDDSVALTVCVPSYNAQSTLKRTLDSLLSIQLADQLQVIIVDDGSIDATAAIGKEYVAKYPKSVMLVTKPNGGHGSGINYGIKYALGQYFRVVDSDDWVNSEALNKQIDYILKNDRKRADVIYTPYFLVDQGSGNRTPWPSPASAVYERLYTFDEAIHEIGVENIYFTMAGSSFRTELLRSMELQLKEKSFYTDSEFILKPIIYVSTVVFLNAPVYRYLRGQAEQSVAPMSFVRHYPDHEAIVRELICYEQDSQMTDAQRAYMRYILEQHLKTNYQILLGFDPDKAHGLSCMAAFDQWLRTNSPFYFMWTQKNMWLVRRVRAVHYNEKRTTGLIARREQIGRFRNFSLHGIAGRIVHSRIFVNRFTRGFLQNQKEKNGFVYRLYKKLKNQK